MIRHTRFDWERSARTGVPEVVLAESKAPEHLVEILREAAERDAALFLTRLSAEKAEMLGEFALDYEALSRTAFFGAPPQVAPDRLSTGIVAAGTSDMPAALEAARALRYFGCPAEIYADVGVAGLWRLQEVLPDLQRHAVLIAVAGMEGALFSVLAGLVRAPVIAVPTSVGYGVAQGGQAALHAALASCSPGLVTVNIDNGFGAAAAARKILSTQTD